MLQPASAYVALYLCLFADRHGTWRSASCTYGKYMGSRCGIVHASSGFALARWGAAVQASIDAIACKQESKKYIALAL